MYIWLKYFGSSDIPDAYLESDVAMVNDKLKYLSRAEESIEYAIFIDRLEFKLEKIKIQEIDSFFEQYENVSDLHRKALNQEREKLINHHQYLSDRVYELEELQKNKDKLIDWYCSHHDISYVKQELQG